MSMMRTLRRGIIHKKMESEHLRKINKKHWFAQNWRDAKWNSGFLKRSKNG